ncbi:hypothetical protein pb186bvf_020284 [Paramecium bursaria]
MYGANKRLYIRSDDLINSLWKEINDHQEKLKRIMIIDRTSHLKIKIKKTFLALPNKIRDTNC